MRVRVRARVRVRVRVLGHLLLLLGDEVGLLPEHAQLVVGVVALRALLLLELLHRGAHLVRLRLGVRVRVRVRVRARARVRDRVRFTLTVTLMVMITVGLVRVMGRVRGLVNLGREHGL